MTRIKKLYLSLTLLNITLFVWWIVSGFREDNELGKEFSEFGTIESKLWILAGVLFVCGMIQLFMHLGFQIYLRIKDRRQR